MQVDLLDLGRAEWLLQRILVVQRCWRGVDLPVRKLMSARVGTRSAERVDGGITEAIGVERGR